MDATNSQNEHDGLQKSLRAAINRHGYALEYRARAEAERAFGEARETGRTGSKWRVGVSEFPVQVQGHDVRADFILEHREHPAFLVVECKRAHPQFCRWLFFKAPRLISDRHLEYLQFDRVEKRGPADTPYVEGFRAQSLERFVARIGVVAKSKSECDQNARGNERDDIEKAIGQACRAAGGLVEHWLHRPARLGDKRQACVIPVVITTADLFITDYDLTKSRLIDGELEEQLDVRPADWLYYQYPRSLSLCPARANMTGEASLARALDIAFTRTVPVVSAPKFIDFLHQFDLDRADFRTI
jgi:hypothetical protein